MMTTTARFLFPTLPAEIRNLIYAHTSSRHIQTNAGLPLKTKTYDSSHTTVTITPVHCGSLALLALRKYRFQEAHEYNAWLLMNGTEIRVSIHFKGHIHTFIEEHWSKKMNSHMKKLVKKYPWIQKVCKWSVQLCWDPVVDSIAQSKAGAIAKFTNAMIATGCGFVDPAVRARKGVVTARLLIPAWLASCKIVNGLAFDLESFLFAPASANYEMREVFLGASVERKPIHVGSGLMIVANAAKETTAREELGQGSILVMRTVVFGGEQRTVMEGSTGECFTSVNDVFLRALESECDRSVGTKVAV